LEFNVPFQHKYGYIRDKFSPGNGGAITMCLANRIGQSVSAQITAGPHSPWCSSEYIFMANVPHKTFSNSVQVQKLQF